MASFPLLDLSSYYLEKIISKLEGKSYCRLQQTCKDLKEFIGTRCKISVSLDGAYEVSRCNLIDAKLVGREIRFSCARGADRIYVYPESLYGIRLECIRLSGILYKYFCEVVKKYRITCNYIIDRNCMNNEKLTLLLDTLKPVKIEVFYRDESPDSFKNFPESKTLKNVCINLDINTVVSALPKFLSSFEEVELTTISHETEELVVFRVLQFFLSQPWPNLRLFQFTLEGSGLPIPTEDEQKELFPEIKLKEVDRSNWEIVFELEELPPHFPPGALCQLSVETSGYCHCRIRYIRYPEST